MPQLVWRRLSVVCAAALALATSVASSAYAAPTLPKLPKGWFVTAEVLYGWRSVGSDGDAVILANSGPGTIYSGGDITTHGRFGADLRFGYEDRNGGFEARYFGGFHWKGSSDLGSPSAVTIAGYGPVVTSGVAASLDSRLNTVEVNLRKPLKQPGFTLFGGVRALSFDDRFTADVGPDRYRFDAKTTAAGLQLGAEGRFSLLTDNVGFELLYANIDVRGGALFERNTQSFATGATTGGSNGSITSPFAEAGVSIGRRIGPYSLEGGYRLFYVNRIPTGEGYTSDATATGSTNNAPVGHSLLVQTLTLGFKGKF